MKDLLSITKALADENRLRVLRALVDGELCVCQLTELLGVATPTVSRHLSILQNAGLVESRKAGRWVYYRLPEAPSPPASASLAWLKGMFIYTDDTYRTDRQRLDAIRCCDVEALCRKQRTS